MIFDILTMNFIYFSYDGSRAEISLCYSSLKLNVMNVLKWPTKTKKQLIEVENARRIFGTKKKKKLQAGPG